MMEITWWKKGPKNSGKGKPPPHFRAMPELKPSFSIDVFPKEPLWKCVVKIESNRCKKSPFKEPGCEGRFFPSHWVPTSPDANPQYKNIAWPKKETKNIKNKHFRRRWFSGHWGWCVSRVGEVFLKDGSQTNVSNLSTHSDDNRS